MLTRRDALSRIGNGFGLVGLASLLSNVQAEPRGPHHPARAKRVIFLFLNGGPSQVDTFDPKPSLTRHHGDALPAEFSKGQPKDSTLLGSPFTFRRYGRSGLEVSELFPQLGDCIDEVCVLRSVHTDLPAHPQAITQMNSGRIIPGFPSMGSWITYGLGTENQNLPGFVAMCPGLPNIGPELWSSGFLPATHQGVYVPSQETSPGDMIRYLENKRLNRSQQRRMLDLMTELNQLGGKDGGVDPLGDARIQAMETAFRMQSEALDAFDVSRESERTLTAYGASGTAAVSEAKIRSATRDGDFARGCLIARRLIERGVRVVQLYFGEDIPWDSHHDILVHRKLALQADQPIAALLKDLKSRGLLEETLVVIGGEFGRTPWVETAGRTNVQNGRNHNSAGFSMLLAGAGVKGGIAYGATDEFGHKAVENRVHVHDLHATILHLLGIDHTRLTYRYSGRDHRLTDVAGSIVNGILS